MNLTVALLLTTGAIAGGTEVLPAITKKHQNRYLGLHLGKTITDRIDPYIYYDLNNTTGFDNYPGFVGYKKGEQRGDIAGVFYAFNIGNRSYEMGYKEIGFPDYLYNLIGYSIEIVDGSSSGSPNYAETRNFIFELTDAEVACLKTIQATSNFKLTQKSTFEVPYFSVKYGSMHGNLFYYAKPEVGIYAHQKRTADLNVYKDYNSDGVIQGVDAATSCPEVISKKATDRILMFPWLLSVGVEKSYTDTVVLGAEMSFFDSNLNSYEFIRGENQDYNTISLSVFMKYKIS